MVMMDTAYTEPRHALPSTRADVDASLERAGDATVVQGKDTKGKEVDDEDDDDNDGEDGADYDEGEDDTGNGQDGQDDDDQDDTHSLTDSIRQHVLDGNLRYHAYHAGMYAFPNGEMEQLRENLKHCLTVDLCDGSLFLAPCRERLERGAQVLDLGTGTGAWCVEMADLFPNSRFHGMDLSPIQPDWVPSNVEFFVDDIEDEDGWGYAANSFDLIHVRHTMHSIKDRPRMWKRIYEHLKPGGYVEVQEFRYEVNCDDGSCDGPYAWRDFLRYLEAGLAALGSQLNGVRMAERELPAAGFAGLRCREVRCAVGPWPEAARLRERGRVLREAIALGLVGLARRPLRDGLGWTELQIEMFLVDVRRDLGREAGGDDGRPPFHSYFPFCDIYGRKPGGGEG